MAKGSVLLPMLLLLLSTVFSSASFCFSSIPFAQRRLVFKSSRLMADSSERKSYQIEVCLDDDDEAESSLLRISVKAEETILNAVERQVSWFVPSDCRRGNCLTCAVSHAEGSVQSNLIQDEDGLSPVLSEVLQQQKFILACSSYVVGNGVKLRLGRNYAAWNSIYNDHLTHCPDTQRICQEASAKAMRMAAEANIKRWLFKTENSYKNPSSD
jgi:ferredoxin